MKLNWNFLGGGGGGAKQETFHGGICTFSTSIAIAIFLATPFALRRKLLNAVALDTASSFFTVQKAR